MAFRCRPLPGGKTFPFRNISFSPGLGFNTFVTGGLVHLREGCTQVSVSGRNSGTVTHGASELEQYLQSEKHITNKCRPSHRHDSIHTFPSQGGKLSLIDEDFIPMLFVSWLYLSLQVGSFNRLFPL